MTNEQLYAQILAAPFYDKVGAYTRVCLSKHSCKGGMIEYDGYLKAKSGFASNRDDGKFYVYLWRHLNGPVFYIGSGTGKRWISKSARNEDFYRNIDKGDAVVYKVIDGVSEEVARTIEKYLSVCFWLGGCMLANKDNSVSESNKDRMKEWVDVFSHGECKDIVCDVENVVLNKILVDSAFSGEDILNIYGFRENCGCRYFSDKYVARTWASPEHMV